MESRVWESMNPCGAHDRLWRVKFEGAQVRSELATDYGELGLRERESIWSSRLTMESRVGKREHESVWSSQLTTESRVLKERA